MRMTNGAAQLPPRTSNITDLDLNLSAICAKYFYTFLEGIKALRSFSYDGISVNHESCDRFWIRVALLQHSTTLESLRLLSLDKSNSYNSYMGSIQAFEALRHLEIELACLVPTTYSKDRYLIANALPRSIETLCLHVSSGYDAYSDPLKILSLADAKNESDLVPKLIRFDTSTHRDIKDLDGHKWSSSGFCRLCRQDHVTWTANILDGASLGSSVSVENDEDGKCFE